MIKVSGFFVDNQSHVTEVIDVYLFAVEYKDIIRPAVVVRSVGKKAADRQNGDNGYGYT
jgi:hypothetical protein